jgi:tetratricopeptide (TPR) repeat protein
MTSPFLIAHSPDFQPAQLDWTSKDQRIRSVTPLSLRSAAAALDQAEFQVLIIVTRESDRYFQELCSRWILSVGSLPDSTLIVCDRPKPQFISEAFEYGIDLFSSWSLAAPTTTKLLDRSARGLASPAFANNAVNLATRAIRLGDQAKMKVTLKALNRYASFDVNAAYTEGRVLEATGALLPAIAAYEQAIKLDPFHRPALMSYAECLLVSGRIDQALSVLMNLELASDCFAPRKAFLAMIKADQGDHDAAKRYLGEAIAIAPNASRTIEARVVVSLKAGHLDEALKLTDQISDAGIYFTASLNHFGITLSQSGKGDDALKLYEKAHLIVRPELRYKISLNAALAAYRLNKAQRALQLIVRCEAEFGGAFEKSTTIRQALLKSLAITGQSGAA